MVSPLMFAFFLFLVIAFLFAVSRSARNTDFLNINLAPFPGFGSILLGGHIQLPERLVLGAPGVRQPADRRCRQTARFLSQ